MLITILRKVICNICRLGRWFLFRILASALNTYVYIKFELFYLAESEPNKSSELEKYWQVVKDNPSDFGGWTYLLHYVEQGNNIEAARKAFNAFFKHYPYCYGYWKKFADMEKNLNNFEAAEKIFEDGTKAIPLSVDLWIHYINFYKEQQGESEDSYENVKRLFKRALAAAGREFRSDRLWDLYVNWEEESKKLRDVTAAYDELLTIPTQLYSHHFEKFRKHVKKNNPREILSTDEFLELRQNVVNTLKHDAVLGEDEDDDKLTDKNSDASPPGMETEDAPPGLEPDGTDIEKDMMSSEEIELMKKKIVEKRKLLHEKNEIEVGKRWSFEEAIKRPYFHVKTLERAQLKNWKDYLDYEIENGTHESTVILFERCMIACALYEDMWLKSNSYILLQLVDVGYQQDPMDQPAILEAFDMALSSDMNNDQKLLFAQRKLEFLEDFSSDPQHIQEAFEDYAKMFKSHYSSRKRSAEEE
ncbi:UNVERIFIED_CONTAM: Pre-mRNA-processing factor 39 [Trichonephila clavipes]